MSDPDISALFEKLTLKTEKGAETCSPVLLDEMIQLLESQRKYLPAIYRKQVASLLETFLELLPEDEDLTLPRICRACIFTFRRPSSVLNYIPASERRLAVQLLKKFREHLAPLSEDLEDLESLQQEEAGKRIFRLITSGSSPTPQLKKILQNLKAVRITVSRGIHAMTVLGELGEADFWKKLGEALKELEAIKKENGNKEVQILTGLRLDQIKLVVRYCGGISPSIPIMETLVAGACFPLHIPGLLDQTTDTLGGFIKRRDPEADTVELYAATAAI
jgi:hypothetical protein